MRQDDRPDTSRVNAEAELRRDTRLVGQQLLQVGGRRRSEEEGRGEGGGGGLRARLRIHQEEHPCSTKELVAIAVPTLLGLADGHCQCGCFTPVVQLCNHILVVSGYCCVYISSRKGTGSSCKAAVPVPARRGDDCLSACLPSNKQIYRLPSRVTDKLYPFLNLLSRILVIPTLTLK